ncbi:MAG: ParB/RepB/Spo0J family partition protein [Kineosporiaceae bacterium]
MAERRRGLGRGIGALIPDAGAPGVSTRHRQPVDVFFDERPGPASEDGSDAANGGGMPGAGEAMQPQNATVGLVDVPGALLIDVPVDAITANPRQPRQVFDEDALAELVASIREVGVLQPVVVRRVHDRGDVGYELIMGERRWRACQLAGLATVPAVVRDTTDDALLRDALLENLHRVDLNPLEEAAAYQQLLQDFGCSQEELSQRIGRSRPQVSNTLRLLKLPAAVQRHVAAGVLSAGHARALLSLEPAAASALASRIIAEGLSVRTVEEIVAAGNAPTRRRTSARAGRRMPLLDTMATRLSDRLDTRVTVSLGKNKGKLTVEFATVDDLNRIVGILDPSGSGFPTAAPDADLT